MTFDSKTNIFSGAFAIAICFCIIIYPFFVFLFLRKHKSNLELLDFESKYGSLYENVRLNTEMAMTIHYYGFFLLRRLIYSMTAVLL